MSATATRDIDSDTNMDLTRAEMPAAANLPRDLAIIKMENDNIMAAAAARPRDYPAILKDLKSQLSTFKAFAEEAMYCRPVGKEKTVDEQGRTTYREKYARGLSIRAAEAIRVAFKYMGVHRNIEMIDEMQARIEAAACDYQTGNTERASRVVSRQYKGRDGTVYTTPLDRFLNTVCQAELSKLVRNCIIAIVSPGLRAELERTVDEQLDSFLDEGTVKKIVAQFSGKGVTPEMLEAHFGKRLEALTKEDRKVLVGVWKALEDGETTVADVFAKPEEADIKRPHAKSKPHKEPTTPADPAYPNETREPVNETKNSDATESQLSGLELIKAVDAALIDLESSGPARKSIATALLGTSDIGSVADPKLRAALELIPRIKNAFEAKKPKGADAKEALAREVIKSNQ